LAAVYAKTVEVTTNIVANTANTTAGVVALFLALA
jgi:hypothetical protein